MNYILKGTQKVEYLQNENNRNSFYINNDGWTWTAGYMSLTTHCSAISVWDIYSQSFKKTQKDMSLQRGYTPTNSLVAEGCVFKK